MFGGVPADHSYGTSAAAALDLRQRPLTHKAWTERNTAASENQKGFGSIIQGMLGGCRRRQRVGILHLLHLCQDLSSPSDNKLGSVHPSPPTIA